MKILEILKVACWGIGKYKYGREEREDRVLAVTIVFYP